jgi:anaerobic selenocysteine-containing dehydrogenase
VVQARIHKPRLLLSRPDAKKLGVTSGDEVIVSQDGRSVALPAQVNRMLGEGLVLISRNLAGRPAEKLVGPNGLYTTVKVEKD